MCSPSSCVIQYDLPARWRSPEQKRKYARNIASPGRCTHELERSSDGCVVATQQIDRQIGKCQSAHLLRCRILVVISTPHGFITPLDFLSNEDRMGRVFIAVHKRINVTPIPGLRLIVQGRAVSPARKTAPIRQMPPARKPMRATFTLSLAERRAGLDIADLPGRCAY